MILKNKIFLVLFVAFSFCVSSTQAQNCAANYEYDTAGYIATFKNTSTSTSGFYKSYWNLGDGNYSLADNPVHAYTNPGKYLVFLKVEDAANKCKDIFMDTVVIVAQSPGCKANYIVEVKGDSLICTALSTGTDSSTTFTWLFENHIFSNDEKPYLEIYKNWN